MKVWSEYGSEHSMKLVMIGSFKDIESADAAHKAIEMITRQLEEDTTAGLQEIGFPSEEYTDGMMETLRQVSVHSIGPGELQQFGYDVQVDLRQDEVVLKTDEVDVSAFMKVLLDKGARVEVFSTHTYPERREP